MFPDQVGILVEHFGNDAFDDDPIAGHALILLGFHDRYADDLRICEFGNAGPLQGCAVNLKTGMSISVGGPVPDRVCPGSAKAPVRPGQYG